MLVFLSLLFFFCVPGRRDAPCEDFWVRKLLVYYVLSTAKEAGEKGQVERDLNALP